MKANHCGFSLGLLGRKLSETPALTAGAAVMQYDNAGRRTRLTWSDGVYATSSGGGSSYDNGGGLSGVGVMSLTPALTSPYGPMFPFLPYNTDAFVEDNRRTTG